MGEYKAPTEDEGSAPGINIQPELEIFPSSESSEYAAAVVSKINDGAPVTLTEREYRELTKKYHTILNSMQYPRSDDSPANLRKRRQHMSMFLKMQEKGYMVKESKSEVGMVFLAPTKTGGNELIVPEAATSNTPPSSNENSEGGSGQPAHGGESEGTAPPSEDFGGPSGDHNGGSGNAPEDKSVRATDNVSPVDSTDASQTGSGERSTVNSAPAGSDNFDTALPSSDNSDVPLPQANSSPEIQTQASDSQADLSTQLNSALDDMKVMVELKLPKCPTITDVIAASREVMSGLKKASGLQAGLGIVFNAASESLSSVVGCLSKLLGEFMTLFSSGDLARLLGGFMGITGSTLVTKEGTVPLPLPAVINNGVSSIGQSDQNILPSAPASPVEDAKSDSQLQLAAPGNAVDGNPQGQ